jgi:hypothetical protein
MEAPAIRLYRLLPQLGRAPIRAGRDADGTLPIRAARYCEAVTLASAFGWWAFPPVDCFVAWDGRRLTWSLDDEWSTFRPIEDTVPFPIDDRDYYAAAPESARKVLPTAYLTAVPEPGLLQISLAVAVRAAPGWGVLVRRPANYPVAGNIEHYEGIVDPSEWFGPLFVNVRFTKTDAPVRLYGDRPIAQIQPVPLAALSAEANVSDFGPEEWVDWIKTVVEPATRTSRPFGEYAVRARRAQR